MDDLPPLEYDYAEQVTAQNNMDIETANTPSTSGPLTYDFTIPPSQTPHTPTRRHLIPSLLVTSIHHRNPPHSWLFLTVLTSWLALTKEQQLHNHLAIWH